MIGAGRKRRRKAVTWHQCAFSCCCFSLPPDLPKSLCSGHELMPGRSVGGGERGDGKEDLVLSFLLS